MAIPWIYIGIFLLGVLVAPYITPIVRDIFNKAIDVLEHNKAK